MYVVSFCTFKVLLVLWEKLSELVRAVKCNEIPVTPGQILACLAVAVTHTTRDHDVP